MTTGHQAGVCSLWFDPAEVTDDDAVCHPDLSEDGQQTAAKIASDVLYVLTNRQWPGVCPRVVRPAFQYGPAGVPCWTWWWGPDPDPRFPFGWASPFRPVAGARVRASTVLRLPGPVSSVTEVKIDGAVLDPSAYQLQGTYTLIRVDGDNWPVGQDWDRTPDDPADGDVPAWQVAYDWGADPPDGAQAAAEALYCQVAAGMVGSDDCRLLWGARLTTVNRRGVSVSYESLTAYLKDGFTGVDEVDLWINAARGGAWRPRGGGRVLRADSPRRRSRWGT